MDNLYYNQERTWVSIFNIKKNSTVLDVGCADGVLARYLAKNYAATVSGVDCLTQCLLNANEHLEYSILGDFTQLSISDFLDHRFDHVIFSDSLEHMADTEKALSLAFSLLEPGGTILLSLPNIQHFSALFPLIMGYWDYKEWGILDRTHLRFFTKNSFAKSLRLYGYRNFRIITPLPRNSKSFFINYLLLGLFQQYLASHIYCEIIK